MPTYLPHAHVRPHEPAHIRQTHTRQRNAALRPETYHDRRERYDGCVHVRSWDPNRRTTCRWVGVCAMRARSYRPARARARVVTRASRLCPHGPVYTAINTDTAWERGPEARDSPRPKVQGWWWCVYVLVVRPTSTDHLWAWEGDETRRKPAWSCVCCRHHVAGVYGKVVAAWVSAGRW